MGRPDPAFQLALPNVLIEVPHGSHPLRTAAPHGQIYVAGHVAGHVPGATARDHGTPGDADARRAALERRLAVALGAPLTLAVTDNHRTMLSLRRLPPAPGAGGATGARHVRLHHMFLDAPGEVVDAMARYLAFGDRRAGDRIDRYIAAHRERIRPAAPPRPCRVEPRGVVHDLAALRDDLATRYLGAPPGDGLGVAITWGRNATGRDLPPRSRQRRTIRMGTYFIDEQLIRIHPSLDQPWVPRYFVEWVIFHELLHHVVPMPVVNGRRCYHTPEFRARERAFHENERAREWERRNLRRLIASRDG